MPRAEFADADLAPTETAGRRRDSRRHVFFDRSIPRDHLAEAGETLAAAARQALGRPDASLRVLETSRIGRSALVTGDPDVLAILPTLPHVADVLGTELQDVYPRPVDRRELKKA